MHLSIRSGVVSTGLATGADLLGPPDPRHLATPVTVLADRAAHRAVTVTLRVLADVGTHVATVAADAIHDRTPDG